MLSLHGPPQHPWKNLGDSRRSDAVPHYSAAIFCFYSSSSRRHKSAQQSVAKRFITGRKIDSESVHLGAGTEFDVALAGLLALLGGSLFLYLSHAIVASL